MMARSRRRLHHPSEGEFGPDGLVPRGDTASEVRGGAPAGLSLLDGIVADENVGRLPTLQIDTRMDGPAERARVARQTLEFAAALAV